MLKEGYVFKGTRKVTTEHGVVYYHQWEKITPEKAEELAKKPRAVEVETRVKVPAVHAVSPSGERKTIPAASVKEAAEMARELHKQGYSTTIIEKSVPAKTETGKPLAYVIKAEKVKTKEGEGYRLVAEPSARRLVVEEKIFETSQRRIKQPAISSAALIGEEGGLREKEVKRLTTTTTTTTQKPPLMEESPYTKLIGKPALKALEFLETKKEEIREKYGLGWEKTPKIFTQKPLAGIFQAATTAAFSTVEMLFSTPFTIASVPTILEEKQRAKLKGVEIKETGIEGVEKEISVRRKARAEALVEFITETTTGTVEAFTEHPVRATEELIGSIIAGGIIGKIGSIKLKTPKGVKTGRISEVSAIDSEFKTWQVAERSYVSEGGIKYKMKIGRKVYDVNARMKLITEVDKQGFARTKAELEIPEQVIKTEKGEIKISSKRVMIKESELAKYVDVEHLAELMKKGKNINIRRIKGKSARIGAYAEVKPVETEFYWEKPFEITKVEAEPSIVKFLGKEYKVVSKRGAVTKRVRVGGTVTTREGEIPFVHRENIYKPKQELTDFISVKSGSPKQTGFGKVEFTKGRGETIQFAAESRPAVRTVETAVEKAVRREISRAEALLTGKKPAVSTAHVGRVIPSVLGGALAFSAPRMARISRGESLDIWSKFAAGFFGMKRRAKGKEGGKQPIKEMRKLPQFEIPTMTHVFSFGAPPLINFITKTATRTGTGTTTTTTTATQTRFYESPQVKTPAPVTPAVPKIVKPRRIRPPFLFFGAPRLGSGVGGMLVTTEKLIERKLPEPLELFFGGVRTTRIRKVARKVRSKPARRKIRNVLRKVRQKMTPMDLLR